jgi:hypothetical protein
VGLGVDGFPKSPKTPFFVIPAKAGIQCLQVVANCLDPGFHRGDDLLQSNQPFDGLKALGDSKGFQWPAKTIGTIAPS